MKEHFFFHYVPEYESLIPKYSTAPWFVHQNPTIVFLILPEAYGKWGCEGEKRKKERGWGWGKSERKQLRNILKKKTPLGTRSSSPQSNGGRALLGEHLLSPNFTRQTCHLSCNRSLKISNYYYLFLEVPISHFILLSNV